MNNITKVTPKFCGVTDADYVEAGNAKYNSNDFDFAIAYYTAAISVQKQNGNNIDPSVYFNRGCARMTRGLFKDAARDFSTCVKINPSNTEAQNELARAEYLARQDIW